MCLSTITIKQFYKKKIQAGKNKCKMCSLKRKKAREYNVGTKHLCWKTQSDRGDVGNNGEAFDLSGDPTLLNTQVYKEKA